MYGDDADTNLKTPNSPNIWISVIWENLKCVVLFSTGAEWWRWRYSDLWKLSRPFCFCQTPLIININSAKKQGDFCWRSSHHILYVKNTDSRDHFNIFNVLTLHFSSSKMRILSYSVSCHVHINLPCRATYRLSPSAFTLFVSPYVVFVRERLISYICLKYLITAI